MYTHKPAVTNARRGRYTWKHAYIRAKATTTKLLLKMRARKIYAAQRKHSTEANAVEAGVRARVVGANDMNVDYVHRSQVSSYID